MLSFSILSEFSDLKDQSHRNVGMGAGRRVVWLIGSETEDSG